MSEKVGGYPSDFILFNDSKLVFYNPAPALPESNYHHLFVYNKDLELMDRLKKRPEDESYRGKDRGIARLYERNSKLYFWGRNYPDTIYVYDDKTLMPYAVFDEGQYEIPEKLRDQNTNGGPVEGKYFQFLGFLESNNHFFIRGAFDQMARAIVFEKQKNISYNLVFKYDIRVRGYDNAYHNDLDGGIPFWPLGVTSDGKLFDYMTPVELKALMKNPYFETIDITMPEKRKELLSILNQASDSDNPILFLVDTR